MEYYIGQIFEDMYPSDAADWCNSNHAKIVEIDPTTKEVEEEYEEYNQETGEIETKTRMVEKTLRRFQIQEIPEPTPEEIKKRRISELKAELDSTDYVVIKIAEAETIEEQNILREHYSDVIINRKSWREEINELEG